MVTPFLRWETHRTRSAAVWIFLFSVGAHLVLQPAFNLILPFSNYSERSGHDGSVYYEMVSDPLPAVRSFSPARYQRILLPALVRAVFAWNRHLGFLLINAVAASVSTVYFYRIVEERKAQSAVPLALLYAVTPYLFAGVHLGLTEPLMMAGLLAGYYYARREERSKATLCYAISVLAKEIAVLPILGEILISLREADPRRALQWSWSLVPGAVWYLVVGLRWEQPLWFLSGAQGNMGFGLGSMIELLSENLAGQGLTGAFVVLNQVANGVLLLFLIVGLYRLRGKPSLWVWMAPTTVSLLILGAAVYRNNFDLGRQALPTALIVLASDRPYVGIGRWLHWSAVAACLSSSVFWTLYFARFFVYY